MVQTEGIHLEIGREKNQNWEGKRQIQMLERDLGVQMLVSLCNGTYCFLGSTHTGCLCVKSRYCECGWSGA